MTQENSLLIAAVLIIVSFAVFAPLVFLASLNTLFPVLAIPYTLKTWAATFFLLFIFGSPLAIRARVK